MKTFDGQTYRHIRRGLQFNYTWRLAKATWFKVHSASCFKLHVQINQPRKLGEKLVKYRTSLLLLLDNKIRHILYFWIKHYDIPHTISKQEI